MRVTAKNSIKLRKLIGKLYVFLEAAVREQEEEIALVTEIHIVRKHILDGIEMAAASVFRVEGRDAIPTHLNATDNPDFQPVSLKHHVWFYGNVEAIVESHIGTNEGEVGPFRHLADTLRTVVPFMVA